MFKALLFTTTSFYNIYTLIKDYKDVLDQEIIKFYSENYEVIYQQFVTSTMKSVTLSSNLPVKKCRFCGQENGDYVVINGKKEKVTFRKISHVIPESLGNKKLFMDYECDLCNAEFGKGIENQFGNWSSVTRTLLRIKGKRGIPTLKKGDDGYRIEYDNDEKLLNVTAYEDDPIFKVDEENKRITFHLQQDSFTPRDVLKAFVKMGVSLIPSNELPPFLPLIDWINGDESRNILINIDYTMTPGPMPNDKITLKVLRRRQNLCNLPYAFFVLSYANETFQIPLPAFEYDKDINGQYLDYPVSPVPQLDYIAQRGINQKIKKLNLNSKEKIVKNKQKFTFRYEGLVPNSK